MGGADGGPPTSAAKASTAGVIGGRTRAFPGIVGSRRTSDRSCYGSGGLNQSLRDMVRLCPLTATTQNTTEKATSMSAERTGEYAVA